MNIEAVMKKLEEIKVELYNNVTSSEDKSPVQVETRDRLPIDEDLAGEEIKIKRTKGEKIKDRGTMSRSSPQDGSKNPDKDYVFGKNAPSIGELQNQLDGLFKDEEAERLEHDSYNPIYDRDGSFSLKEFATWLLKMDILPNEFFNKLDDDYEREQLQKVFSKLRLSKYPEE